MTDLVENFEQILKKQSVNRSVKLYSINKQQNRHHFKPQDVILSVSKQLKAFQVADSYKTDEHKKKDLQKYSKSNFLSINKLPTYDETQKQTSKFDTQLVSDTELINVIEHAEIIDVHRGITQEFETSFCHETDKNNTADGKIDSNISENDKDKALSDKCEQNNIKDNTEDTKDSLEMNNYIKNVVPSVICSNNGKERDTDDKTQTSKVEENTQEVFSQILNECIDIEDDDIAIEIPISPIFMNKQSKTKSKTPSPLIFSLDKFEQFEKIAISLLETNDTKTAKHVIDSQILDKELDIKLGEDIFLNEREELSPILQIKHDEKVINPNMNDKNAFKTHIIKDSETGTDLEFIELDKATSEDLIKKVMESTPVKLENNVIKDEILFSSDEEDNSRLKGFQDMPFTCALETSFYDQPDVLDKTMYVAFQTASNKSIQICTESFVQAKSLLNDTVLDEVTVTDLVKNCDNYLKSKTEETINNKEGTIDSSDLLGNDVELEAATENIKDKFNTLDNKASKDNNVIDIAKQNFQGFVTANNKEIKLSTKALARCQIVFQDIDLNEDFANVDKINRSTSGNEPKHNVIPETIDKNKTINDDMQNIDDVIIQEFENIEMSLHEDKEADKDKGVNELKVITLSYKHTKTSDTVTKLKDIFNDVVFDDDLSKTVPNRIEEFSVNNNEKESIIGFKTASNKNIDISKEALAKTKHLFQDIDSIEIPRQTSEKNNDLNDIEQSSTSNTGFIGFKTANNKPITISEQALAKSKNVFKDIDYNNADLPANLNKSLDFEETDFYKSNVQPNKTSLIGFKTASNKNIKVSKEACMKTGKIFKDIDSTKFPQKNNEDIRQMCEGTEYILDYNQPSTSKASFVGFKTANNKDIKISDKALSKTKNIFKDIDSADFKYPEKRNIETEKEESNIKENKISNEEFKRPLAALTSFQGFKTASNRVIKISDIALAKTKNVFRDIDDSLDIPLNINNNNTDSDKLNKEYNNFPHSTKNLEFVGFKTANNRKISISKKALEKSKNIFKDIDDCKLLDKPFKAVDNFIHPESKEMEDTSEIQVAHLLKPSTSKAAFVGFQTANNKKINISKKSLAKTKNIFKDIDSTDFQFPGKPHKENKNSESKKTYPDTRGHKPNFIGFKTANNKLINISEKALAKTKDIFKDIDSIDPELLKKQKADYPNIEDEVESIQIDDFNKDISPFAEKDTKTSIPIFQGFQTASNKQVKVSKEALLKSKEIFQDIDKPKSFNTESRNINNNDINKEVVNFDGENNTAENKEDYDHFSSVFKGFQTANKKVVAISKEAIAKTKKLFEDIMLNEKEGETFHGFKTANDKIVSVSEKALSATKTIFDDINTGLNFPMRNDIKGFNTGQHLRKELQENMDTEKSKNDLNIEKRINCHSKFGFQTGSNKQVLVSEEAVKRCKRLFSDTESNENQSKKKNDKSHEEIISNIIDTQVLNNFEESLHTEDFHDTPVKSKRSGSPILSCPKAKRRKKFETPYSQKLPKTITKPEITIKHVKKINFNGNYKKNKTYTLKDLTNLTENSNTETDPYLLQFSFDNLLQFEFHDDRNGLSYNNMTVDLLKELFVNSVNGKIIPNGWLDNHLKLILWKLISYEIKYKSAVVCSARNVVDQLKYRYDRELYNAQRPALRKILEKDDVASKTMVLCVAQIYEDGISVCRPTTPNNIELLLTDGWYSIKASIDKMLAQLVCDGKINVGTKLVTNGAELVNCEQGVSPWEDTSAVRLKIFGNSTRRARWDARLGYHSNSAILTQLSSVKLDGGKISKLRVLITRVYPALYVEKFEDGSTVTRSERLEHLHQMKTETERQAVMEKLYEEVEREFSDQESQDSECLSDVSLKRSCLDSGSQIAKLMKRSKDPAEFRAGLTSSQSRLLEAHTSKRRERLLEDIQKRIREKIEKAGVCVNRNVVTLLKIRVAGLVEKNGVEVTKGMISIWKPNDAILEIVKEGAWIDIMNVVPTAVRYSEIQISAGRQSVFSTSKYKEPEKFKPYTNLLKRNCFTIKNLVQNPAMSTDFNEIDTVGIVFLIDPLISKFDSNKNPFQNVYLADADKNIICINFWGGLIKFGYQNVLDTGQIVACANLQKRAGNTRKSIPQFRVTEFSVFTKTPKNENARSMVDDLNKKFLSLDRRKFCEDCVVLKNNYSVIKNNCENISPYRFNNSDYNISKNKIFIDSPLIRPSRIDDNFNLTGLDFESTFKQTDTQNISEEALNRKKKVNDKIAKLKMYGEPPPLSNIHIINKSKNASNSYKSPLLSNNNNNTNFQKSNPVSRIPLNSKYDSYDNVASVNNTPEKCGNVNDSDVSSPGLMNRTYVKRVNPIKLNFDVKDNNDSNIDHFAEEFDGSPPLSLD